MRFYSIAEDIMGVLSQIPPFINLSGEKVYSNKQGRNSSWNAELNRFPKHPSSCDIGGTAGLMASN